MHFRHIPTCFTRFCGCVLMGGIATVAMPAAHGDILDWQPPSAGGGGSSVWASAGNWAGGVAPANDLVTDIARFNQTSYAFQPNAGTTGIAGLVFGDGGTFTAPLTLSGTSLSIGADGVTQLANAGTTIVFSPVVLGAAQTWSNDADNLLAFSGSVTNGGNTLAVDGSRETRISGTISGSGGIVKTGSGTLSLAGNNTGFTGGMTIRSGTVVSNGTSATAANNFGIGTITLGDTTPGSTASATLLLSATGGGPVYKNSVVAAAGTTGTLTIANTGNIAYVFNSGTFTLDHDLVLSNTGTNDGVNHYLVVNSTLTGSGDLIVENTSNHVNGRAGIGTGADNSTWTGDLRIKSGFFRIGSSTTATTASNAVYLGETAYLDYNVTLATIAGLNDLDGVGGTVDNTHNNASRLLRLGGSGDYSFSGVIQDSTYDLYASHPSMGVSMDGDGTQVLAGLNTYRGATVLNDGVLSVSTLADGGVASSIGASTNAAANLLFHGGTLRYTGAGATTDRLFSLGKTGGTIDASGSGALVFSNTDAIGAYYVGSDADPNDLTGTLTLTGSNTDANTIAAAITDPTGVDLTGTTSLTKDGSGTWVLSGVNTYTGVTTVNNGTLHVAAGGSIAGDAVVHGGSLGGSGAIGGNVTINSGKLTPGSSPGILTLANGVSFTSSGQFEVELAGTAAGATYDQLAVTGGGISLGDATLSVLLDSFIPPDGAQFIIIDNQTADAIAGIFSGLAEGAVFAAGSSNFQISYLGGDGNDVVLTSTVIPEPSMALIAGTAGLMLVCRRDRG